MKKRKRGKEEQERRTGQERENTPGVTCGGFLFVVVNSGDTTDSTPLFRTSLYHKDSGETSDP